MSKDKDPYKDSAYDASGMPLGTETCDYDNADERRLNQVKDLYVPVPTIFDDEYQPAQFDKKTVANPDPDKFNSAITDEAELSLKEQEEEAEFLKASEEAEKDDKESEKDTKK